jgi:hypothetical protein
MGIVRRRADVNIVLRDALNSLSSRGAKNYKLNYIHNANGTQWSLELEIKSWQPLYQPVDNPLATGLAAQQP